MNPSHTNSKPQYARFWANRRAWAEYYGLPIQPAYLQAYDTQSAGKRKRLLIAPVGHGKSWKASMVEILHRICYNRDIRILVVSKTFNQAKNDIQMVRMEIERNATLRADYGLEASERWGDESFTVQRQRILKEPTVTAVGLYGQAEGLRLDYIAGDDIIDWEVTFSEVEREKTKQWFDNTLQARLEPNGEMFVIGTRWHPNDLYDHISKQPGWHVKVYQAIQPDGQALWPERWPLNKLAEIRADMGETMFQLKYMNNPLALEGGAFKPEWLQFVDSYPQGMRIVVGVDPAATKRELAKADPDATALVTVGESNGVIYILDITIAYIDANYADLIANTMTRWGASEAAVEANLFQKLIVRDMQARYPDRNVWAEEHYATDKVTRILDLQPKFQSRHIAIWKGCQNLEKFQYEYLGFPTGAHDDILDALEMAVKRVTRPKNEMSLAGVWEDICPQCQGKGGSCYICQGTGKRLHVASW